MAEKTARRALLPWPLARCKECLPDLGTSEGNCTRMSNMIKHSFGNIEIEKFAIMGLQTMTFAIMGFQTWTLLR
jgi:hypothetical protein